MTIEVAFLNRSTVVGGASKLKPAETRAVAAELTETVSEGRRVCFGRQLFLEAVRSENVLLGH